MKILFLANHLNVGGISSYLLGLSSGLIEKGHQVFLASSGGELAERFTACGVKLIGVGLNTKNEASPKILLSLFKLNRAVKKHRIELVHTNSRTTQVLGDLLSRWRGIAHIFTCHGFFKPKLSRKIFPCWPKFVIAISNEVKDHLIKDFGLGAGKITVINNGIDLKKFGDFSQREKTRESLGVKNEPLIGIIARLSDVKGHIYLIRAVHRVIRTFMPVKLLIVGEGKEKDALVREAEQLAIINDCLFVPQAKDTQSLLSAMDIFVMPSLQEGLGLALMEAMAQGLPVIGSNVGGIRTLIRDKETGLLVEPADAQPLVNTIILLLQDANLNRTLKMNARKFIADNFSKEDMVNKTEEVYLKAA